MKVWPTRTVAELQAEGLLLVEDGNHGEYRPRPSEFVRTGVAFIRAADMTTGTVDFRGASKINDLARNRIRKGVGKEQDVLLSHKGTVGKVAFVAAGSPEFVCSPQTTFWRSLVPSAIAPEYLRYYLQSPAFRVLLASRSAETDMAPYVSLTDQRGFDVPLPPIEEQRGIAATLGALDDKIESNRRSIGLIQDLSRMTYVAWRATHPNTRDSTFGDFAEVFGGATPKTTDPRYWGGAIAWATPTDITALSSPYLFETSRMLTDAGLASTSATLHPAGTILMTSRATIGSFALTQIPAATNQGFIAVRPRRPEHRWFLFEEMRARVPEMLDRANGSTFMELSRGNFKLMSLAVPDEAAIAELDSVLAPLHTKAAQLDRESSRLAKVRDTLLPELLSGRIRVPEAAAIDDAL